MPNRPKPLFPGEQIGNWTVVELASPRKGHTAYLCRCKCGKTKVIRRDSLKCGDSTQCHSCAGKQFIKHGENRKGKKSSEYSVWAGMIHRCSVNCNRSRDYHDRGITVCEQWRGKNGFEVFLAEVGRRPSSEHTLDRIDNDRGYEPGNVRWATSKEQARNRRNNRLLTINGITKCIAEWADESPVTQIRIRARLNNGWDAQTAVFAPVRGK